MKFSASSQCILINEENLNGERVCVETTDILCSRLFPLCLISNDALFLGHQNVGRCGDSLRCSLATDECSSAGVQPILLFEKFIGQFLPSRNTHATVVRGLSLLDGIEHGHQSHCLRFCQSTLSSRYPPLGEAESMLDCFLERHSTTETSSDGLERITIAMLQYGIRQTSDLRDEKSNYQSNDR